MSNFRIEHAIYEKRTHDPKHFQTSSTPAKAFTWKFLPQEHLHQPRIIHSTTHKVGTQLHTKTTYPNHHLRLKILSTSQHENANSKLHYQHLSAVHSRCYNVTAWGIYVPLYQHSQPHNTERWFLIFTRLAHLTYLQSESGFVREIIRYGYANQADSWYKRTTCIA